MDVLEILDMTEEEQAHWIVEWLEYNGQKGDLERYNRCELSLADLAFRMRNEAVRNYKKEWDRAIVTIQIKYATSNNYGSWWQNMSQPIHWIVAALKAKEIAKK
jgi:hypothetical protein